MQCTDALAFEAAAALEAYEEQLLAMRGPGAAPRGAALIQRELTRVCGCCLRLPQLAGASVGLMIAHHRLLADLASRGEDGRTAPGAARLQEVEQCLAILQRSCRELFLAPHLH